MYGIYIHIPFCSKICHYCDFFVDKDVSQLDKYINALIYEIDINFATKTKTAKVIASSIYFGGGTPSLLSPVQLSKIVNKLKEYFEFAKDLEFSFESNPGSISLENLVEYRNIGVNRISIGVQSFVKRELGFLKRNHSPRMAVEAIEVAHKAGFDNINLDLIFAIPGQTFDTWEYSLKSALNLGTQHISTYSLMYEAGTPLYNKWKEGKVAKVSDDTDSDFYLYTIDKALELGFEQYEVSNFAQSDFECRHNLHTWHSGEYYAFGASSHGYVDSTRFKNYRNFKNYYSAISEGKLPREEEQFIDFDEKKSEFALLSIRADGFDLYEYSDKFQAEISPILLEFITKLEINQYAVFNKNILKLTGKGYAICDSITQQLLEFL